MSFIFLKIQRNLFWCFNFIFSHKIMDLIHTEIQQKINSLIINYKDTAHAFMKLLYFHKVHNVRFENLCYVIVTVQRRNEYV